MTRAAIRTHFSGSKLLRILSDLSVMEKQEAGSAFAEKLGYWVGFTDAIALHGVHSTGETQSPIDKSGGTSPSASKANADWIATQRRLETSVNDGFAANADMFLDEGTPYTLIRKFHAACQRDLELGVRPLRIKVREQVARASPALTKLAALDAVFEDILADREKKLLATLPSMMERRFQHLKKGHPHQERWLAAFGQELQTVMLAELELRLLPAAGLIATLNNHADDHTNELA